MMQRFTRGAIVGKLTEMAGLSNHEEASQKSKPYRIKRDNRDLEEVITALRSTMVRLLTIQSFTICHRGDQHSIKMT